LVLILGLDHNSDSIYPIGTYTIRNPDFLMAYLSYRYSSPAISALEVQAIRVKLANEIPKAVRQEAISLWHDIRNACTLLTDSWGLLIEDGEDSLAFSASDNDSFEELVKRRGLIRNCCVQLNVLISDWYHSLALEASLSIIKSVFTEKAEDSMVLKLFLNYPATRHPEHDDNTARERYSLLVQKLTMPDMVEMAASLRGSLNHFEKTVNECFRGKGTGINAIVR